MIECPDCGKFFKGNKCSCGYSVGTVLKVDFKERESRYQELKNKYENIFIEQGKVWEKKKTIMASLSYRGPLRWAHEIIALKNAGLYDDFHGIEMAEKVLNKYGETA